MPHWLVKTEPGEYSIDDLQRDKSTAWTQVRNYQARNYLREMKPGDEVLIYHSNAEPSGIVGVGKVKAAARPDPTQFDKKSDYYDPKATAENPRWFAPELSFGRKFRKPVPLEALKREESLEGLQLLQRGSRLSVMSVSPAHFAAIMKIAG
jgi:predicted RNA-binding protein with PUA-like domain